MQQSATQKLSICTLLLLATCACGSLSRPCDDPMVTSLGSYNIFTCFKHETLKNGMDQYKIAYDVAASPDADPIIKNRETITEELVRCESLEHVIGHHEIGDFECPRYGAFVNGSRVDRFVQKFTLRSKGETLGKSRPTRVTEIYFLNDETVKQQVSEAKDEFFGSRSDIKSQGWYFVVNTFNKYQSQVTLSGDIYLSSVPGSEEELALPMNPIEQLGLIILKAIEHGYMLELRNIEIAMHYMGDPFKITTNFTIAQQSTFPYFSLKHTMTTSVPELFDYEGYVTQENTADRYSTHEAYSTHISMESRSKIPALNFNLRQKFQNSGADLYEWYETMRLATRYFAADVLAVAEDGFRKRLYVVDKEGRRGLEVTYGDYHDDAIDFKIHLKQSVMNKIINDIVEGFTSDLPKNTESSTSGIEL